MNCRLWSLVLGLLVGCGGGGGVAAPTTATVSGALSLPAAAPLARAAPTPRGPGSTYLQTVPLTGRAVGALDAGVHAYRAVAEGGPVRAQLAGGFDGDALIHDLATGAAARALVLAPGTPVHVVVFGAGRYEVELVAAAGDTTPRALPDAYRDPGLGAVPGEIVAALRPGVTPGMVTARTGLACHARGPVCLFFDATAAAPGFAGACALLARCARLEADGLARYAEPNMLRRLAGRPSDPRYDEQWALEQIRMPDAWEIKTDATLVVAVVDSGIRMHPDVVANLVAGYDFVDDDQDPTDATRSFAHGTQVVSVLAGVANNGIGVAGVCWSARVMPVRSFGTSGFGTAFDIANGILFAAGRDNASGTVPAEAARVINLSFAASTPTQSEEDACIAARGAGILVIAAAGNDSSSNVRYPAGYASVLAVAATTIAGTPASYSNRGRWIDIAAPGGTRTQGVLVAGVGTGDMFDYIAVNGTSFASPAVAGVAVLALCVRDMTVDELEQLLLDNARDIHVAGDDERTGRGLLDAYAVLLGASNTEPPILGPFEPVTVQLRQHPSGAVFQVATTDRDAGLTWTFPMIPAGMYRLEAGTDRDLDGRLDEPGEVFG
ncbi:MAG: S8 family serine peptidase, partial [Planctomycetota bacterium]|nr:S8 family serine peptidase [Planctomycetota bacterium]